MISCPVLYYNTTIYEENGLSKTPDTWAELVDVAKKLTQPDKKQWGYFSYGGRNDFLMANWQNGGELLTPDKSTPAFNATAGVEAVQWIVDLEHKHGVMPPLNEQDTNIIYQNRVGMWFQAMSRLGRYKRDAPDLTYATAILPKKVKRTTIEMGNGAILMKDGKNQDGAFRFLVFLCTDSWAQQLYSQETGYASAAKDVLNSDFYAGNPILRPFQWQILNDIKSRPVIPNCGEMLDIIGEEMEQVMYLKKTPQQMLDDTEARVKQVLSSF
jgi:ABC-type glycerol-3-phosphate transport system substrate-binding protein